MYEALFQELSLVIGQARDAHPEGVFYVSGIYPTIQELTSGSNKSKQHPEREQDQLGQWTERRGAGPYGGQQLGLIQDSRAG